MQIQVFSIPMEGDEEATEQLNRFLRTHKVLCFEKAPIHAHPEAAHGHVYEHRVAQTQSLAARPASAGTLCK